MELIDFSVGFPSAEKIKQAGFGGVILYFSHARENWMKAKPASESAVRRYQEAGLEIVCNYQFGKGKTSDWYEGFDGGVKHARIMQDLVTEAGLGTAKPVMYGPVDANPTLWEHNTYVAPFFKGWESVFGHDRSGAYANTHTIDWLLEDGLCSYFWQHGWDGRAPGVPLTPHPSAHLLQYEIDKSRVDNIGIDRNRSLQDYFGQVRMPSQDEDKAMSDFLYQLMGPKAQ